MRRVALLATMLAGMTLALHPGTAAATPTQPDEGVASASEQERRTAPYDFGCISYESPLSPGPPGSTDAPCYPEDTSSSFEPARQGILQAFRYPWARPTFFLPVLSRSDARSATGIHIDVPTNSFVTASATLRTAEPVETPPPAANWACLGVQGGFFVGGYGCQPVRGGTIELTSDFDGYIAYTELVTVFVYLTGCPACDVTTPSTVRVESISYALQPTAGRMGRVRTLTVSVLGSRSARVVSGDGAIRCGRRRAECSAQYRQGAKVELTAVPGRHSRFKRWTGCDRSARTTCTVTIRSGDEQVAALFRRRAS